MKQFRVVLDAHGPQSTAWQADTIWGHLCWGLRYLHGSKALNAFLARYHAGDPPIIVSDGFPDDMLPRPLLPALPAGATLPLQQRREQFEAAKKGKDRYYLSPADFTRVLRGQPIAEGGESAPVVSAAVLKNRIDRTTGTTGAGGELFSFDEQRWPAITVYAGIADDFVDSAAELFGYLAAAGYGKRKSVGYGSVALRSFAPFAGLPVDDNPNAFVSLSSFVPAAVDPVNGYWQTRVKYAKLGEEFAVSGNPFKRPFVQLTAGSVFFDEPVRPWYGRLVVGLSPSHPEAVQYGLALPLPVHVHNRGDDV